MIRRVISVILFVFGGWILAGELGVGFIDVEPGIGDNVMMIGAVTVIAAIPLLLGSWASPGRRWQELGLAILIATGVAVFCGVCSAVVLSDPGFMQFMPPMQKVELAPVFGFINLLIVGAVGWLLYRPARQAELTSTVR